MKKIFRTFTEWFSRKYYNYYFCADIPERIAEKAFYIVGEKSHPWVMVFRCPCGCKQIIQLNLLKEGDPRWSFRISTRKEINVRPSVWRTKGCKSHFVIRNSKIDWVTDKWSFTTD